MTCGGEIVSKITDAVRALAEPVTARLGLELWDVEYVREAGTHYLRVYIDRPGEGVFISDCEAVSKALDPILDEKDPVPDSYTFEVSSAGAERALKRPEHFERCMGRRVEARLFTSRNGSKTVRGTLCGYEDGAVLVDTGEETLRLEKKEVAGVRLTME